MKKLMSTKNKYFIFGALALLVVVGVSMRNDHQSKPETGEDSTQKTVSVDSEIKTDVIEQVASPSKADAQTIDSLDLLQDTALKSAFSSFWENAHAEGGMSEDEYQAHYNKLADIFDASSQARADIAELYITDLDARYFLEEMLVGYTEAGHDLLIEQNKRILQGANLTDFDVINAFRILASDPSDSVDLHALDLATGYAASYVNNGDSSLTALSLMGKAVLPGADIPDELRLQTLENLEKSAVQAYSPTVQMLSIKGLYGSADTPEAGAAIADKFVQKFSENNELLVETLFSIDGGELALTDELKTSLDRSLSKLNLSEQDRALKNRILNGEGLSPREEAMLASGELVIDEETGKPVTPEFFVEPPAPEQSE